MAKALAGKRFKNIAAQGELGFTRLPNHYHIPKTLRKTPNNKHKGKSVLIIGHSETGHHHVMDPEKTTSYELAPGSKILVVKEADTLAHLRNNATHEPLHFEPGKYMVQTLREFDVHRQRSMFSQD